MRVLITGAGGQLGTDLAIHCRAEGDVVAALGRGQLDITDRDAVRDAVEAHEPDIVLNAAAWTAVDACESDPTRAYEINGTGPRWVAEASRAAGAHLVHVSTDYVFDGTKDDPYAETDLPAPRSVYGASKLAGERAVQEVDPRASVVRTAWVMGVHGHNMLKTVLSLRDRDHLEFVDDQRGSPTFTADLAVALRRLATERLAGVFHVTNRGSTTWYGLAREILEAADCDPDIVAPIRTDQLEPPRPAPRPANSVLDGVAWRNARLPALPLYRDSLRTTVELLLGRSVPLKEPS